ncbi:MAG: hypothetical protein ACKVOL_11405 [Novosphingobium sp.]
MIVWLALGLAACSADTALLGDYTLHDFGGSNQTILGNQGAMMVGQVTSLAINDPFIYVESYQFDDPRNCSYKLIDTSNHSLMDLPAGTLARRQAIAAIKTQRKEIMPRSCVFRP